MEKVYGNTFKYNNLIIKYLIIKLVNDLII